MTAIGTQIDSDRRLLEFKNYEEYLDSLITSVDLCYLNNIKVARQVAELGYRCTGETLTKDAFHRRLAAVKNLLFPIHRPYTLTSEFVIPKSVVMQELALRERPNRLHIISTIIFVRHFANVKFEISGYIDFCDRLDKEDWFPYFGGKKILRPRITDLAFYHWRMGKTYLNDSSNFKCIIEPKEGLLFKNVHDRRIISVDPTASSHGVDTTRVQINSQEYEHLILYDHVIRTNV